jgi:glutamine amidotransferase
MRGRTVGVLDYEAGNLTSVETALKHLGARYRVSADPEELKRCDQLIFPGVGEARAAMRALQRSGLDRLLRDFATGGAPMLGICLGCQIILTATEENDTACLDILPGTVRRFPADAGVKIPHMGWNTVSHGESHPLFQEIPEEASFYFVHSYYPALRDAGMEIGRTHYGIGFSSAFARENLLAVQFHPEKSGRWGLKLLENFLKLSGGGA